MCRISGIINSKETLPTLQQNVTKMCNSMAHGGPDDFGIYTDADFKLCMGHRRLSIIDMGKTGHQPMLTADGNIVISYNGEIYNFLELKKELIVAGYVFKTNSDTEVIINAYLFWGELAFEKLNGMFAFCLYDKNKQSVYLVRDQSGIKPLYYSTVNNQLTFASETKAFKHAELNLQENPNWKIYFLAFGHIPEPYTTFKNIFSVPKGCFLKYNLTNQSFTINTYFEFSNTIKITDEKIAISLIKEELNNAVKRQLITDTSIGVLYSGGLDSSIIALLANNHLEHKLTTLSANFNEIDFSEKKYRTQMSEGLLARHKEEIISYRNFAFNFNTILESMDQPSNDGINNWFICKYAKENGIKSVLSGLGADELFGGYPSFNRIRLIQNFNNITKFFVKGSRFLENNRYKRLYYLSFQSAIGEYLCLRGLYSPDTIAKLLDIDIKTVTNCLQNVPVNNNLKNLNNQERASWFETNMYMQNQLLKDTDFMSMSHGVEVRLPFLDNDFVKLVNSIDPKIRFNNQIKKKLLIDAFKPDLPQAIWKRNKMGFTFPFQEWMRQKSSISNPELYKNKTAKNLILDFNKNNLHWSAAFALHTVYNA